MFRVGRLAMVCLDIIGKTNSQFKAHIYIMHSGVYMCAQHVFQRFYGLTSYSFWLGRRVKCLNLNVTLFSNIISSTTNRYLMEVL